MPIGFQPVAVGEMRCTLPKEQIVTVETKDAKITVAF
jgi:hypothetical protein